MSVTLSALAAEKVILDLVEPIAEQEPVELNKALGRILAAPIKSGLDFPYWDNSAMDGYAVRYADVVQTSPDEPVSLKIIEEIPAGKIPQTTVNEGEAARIYTGSMLPQGADTIIMQEKTQVQDDQVLILHPPSEPQAFVRRRGEYYQKGNPLLQPGITLNAQEIGILATIQASEIPVYRRPRVAIFSTGDELINPDQPLELGKIIDSNQYALTSFILSQTGIPIQLGIVRDNPEILREKINKALVRADFILSTGGVSVGAYDYVEQVLTELGADIKIRSVAVKPGKPLTVARFESGCIYFGIPGNPVSALVSCWRFVKPALDKLSGKQGPWTPQWISAQNLQPLRSTGDRETYIWGRLNLVKGVYQFEPATGSNSSGNLMGLAQTNALAVVPINQKEIQPGAMIMTMKLI
ncbi:gephyrin-like molybdotransferase Glp [Gloeocapsa sp. PCC 73106]|uniref:molybdopterin molybdotransferase MoeA n=1 Tax=Gloeocapsa sp. PCC 73106 TaxID=102232 RepID=UPI0002AC9C90|nr:gephyrin-like molybdotransferase Glp [Gloeocapsa sp. PCC 73106]ELR97780.1 molybdenum cofactor synthesis domain protein [Gloeocapsa sp. PCC 73106]